MKPDGDLQTQIRDGRADPLLPESDSANVSAVSDRGSPNWARYISFLFSLGTGVCLIALAVITIFFQSLVAISGEVYAAPLLLGLVLVPVSGIIVLDIAHARALAGFREARQRTEALAHSALALLLCLALGVLHPLLALPAILGCIVLACVLYLQVRWGQIEPLWDFQPSEAVSVLSGRDEVGFRLAGLQVRDHGLGPHAVRAMSWMALALAFGVGSWLAAREVVSVAAIAAVGLITLWVVGAFGRYVLTRQSPDIAAGISGNVVETLAPADEDLVDVVALGGLQVSHLSVSDGLGNGLLNDISFDVAPGEIVGVIGEAAAGKSLLLRACINPYDIDTARVQGRVTYNGQEIWQRSANSRQVSMVHVPATARMLPASGAENLTCFQNDDQTDRSGRCLESLVFSTDAVDRIRIAPDARRLSACDQKALSLARAFLLNPSCYLIDRPEDSASDKLMAALIDRIQMERRAGRSFVIATDHRGVLEACDKLLMLQEGRVVDFAPAAEIRGRLSSGWMRFVTPRQLESEMTLTTWIRSHFKRNGDEENRAKLCTVAAELLAFSCQGVKPGSNERIYFDFKHFEGHALLKLVDDTPLLSSGQMELAQREADEQGKNTRLSPLAKLIRLSESLDQSLENNKRVITVKISTYDPRKTGQRPPKSA